MTDPSLPSTRPFACARARLSSVVNWSLQRKDAPQLDLWHFGKERKK